MLENKRYGWVMDYRAPADHTFVCALFKNIYWAYTYMKLVYQGTQEDKYELAKLYDEAYLVRVGVDSGPFSLKFNPAFGYRYAATQFISNVRRRHFGDERRRESLINQSAAEKRRVETTIYLNGYDPEEERLRFELIEMTLESENVGNHRRNDPVLADASGERFLYPDFEEARAGRLVTEFTKMVTPTNGIPVAVHARIYDKVIGYYTILVWSEARPRTASGAFEGYTRWCRRLIGRGDRFGTGAVNFARAEMHKEADRVLFNDFSDHVPTVKTKEPNIGKVKQALGVDDSCGDDLDGNIF